ncbi:hypothetical protein ACEPAI_1708 [Sanghuangporus weigelae]
MDFQNNPVYQFLQDLETERVSPFTQREKSPSILDSVQEPVAPYSLDFGCMDDFDFVNLVHQPVASNAGTNERPTTADVQHNKVQDDHASMNAPSTSSSQYTVHQQLSFDAAFDFDAYDMLAQPGTAFEDHLINETQPVSDLFETNELFGEASQPGIPSLSMSYASMITSDVETSRGISSLTCSHALDFDSETFSPSSSTLNISTPEVETPRDTSPLRWSYAPEHGSVPSRPEMSSSSSYAQNISVAEMKTPRNASQWRWTSDRLVEPSTIGYFLQSEKRSEYGVKIEARTPAIRVPGLPILPDVREASIPSQAQGHNTQIPDASSAQVIAMTESYCNETHQHKKRKREKAESDAMKDNVDLPCSKTGPKKRRLPCTWPGCPRTFVDASTRKRHINGPHRNIRFTCPGNCREKAFSRMDSLRRHLRLRGPTSSCWFDALASGWTSFTNEDGQPDIRKPGTERARKRRKRDA